MPTLLPPKRRAQHLSRRAFGLSLAAFGTLVACQGGGGGSSASSRPIDTGLPTAPNAGYDAWVVNYRPRAMAAGISPQTFDRAFRQAGFVPGVVERDRNQTEFTRSLQDYLAIAASDERISKGRANHARHQAALRAVEQRYGVEGHVVTAVWGLESYYGERRGAIPVVSAVSTLAYDGRRGAFFEQQLTAALKILERGDITAERMTGSWAGAMGHTQFMPTSYQAYAVDFTGDGRRDIWSDDPADSLASTANYLAKSGWKRGQPWGVEVRLPEGFSASELGRKHKRSVSEWSAMGVRAMSGGTVRDHGPASIIAPMGLSGPAFMVFHNFTVITRYNNSENYVIGVGHLSDRILGAGPVQAEWPADRYGMRIKQRQELQRRLSANGFDAGGDDGVFGTKTKAAIEGYQARAGLPVTGEPSLELLSRLGG